MTPDARTSADLLPKNFLNPANDGRARPGNEKSHRVGGAFVHLSD